MALATKKKNLPESLLLDPVAIRLAWTIATVSGHGDWHHEIDRLFLQAHVDHLIGKHGPNTHWIENSS